MDLEKLMQEDEAAEVIRQQVGALRHNAEQQKTNREILADIDRQLSATEKPFTDFASDLFMVSGAERDRRNRTYFSHPPRDRDSDSRSLLFKLRDERGVAYYGAVEKRFIGYGMDGEGYPTREELVGYSFVVAAGVPLSTREYYKLTSTERRDMTRLGSNLKGAEIYGKVVGTEDFGHLNSGLGSVEQARRTLNDVTDSVPELTKTLTMMREALNDPILNPPGAVELYRTLRIPGAAPGAQ